MKQKRTENKKMGKRGSKGFFLLCCLVFAVLCSGCGKKEEALGQGSVRFAELSVEIDDNGDEFVFARGQNKKFEIEIVEQLWPGYGAVCDGKYYYFEEHSSESVSLLPSKESRVQLLSCGLREDFRAAKVVAEWEGEWERAGDAFIQEGWLYCSWKDKDNTRKHVVINLESEKTTEFSVPEERVVAAVTASGYYYLEDGKVYFSEYKDGKEKLFFEADGQVRALYQNGENFCALVEREDGIFAAVLDGKGKLQKEYGDLEQVEGLQKGYRPVFIKAKNGILYYILTAKKEGTSYNTWLIRADLEAGTREACGGWYVKQEE